MNANRYQELASACEVIGEEFNQIADMLREAARADSPVSQPKIKKKKLQEPDEVAYWSSWKYEDAHSAYLSKTISAPPGETTLHPGWYFFDETGGENGPFLTQDIMREAQQQYNELI